MNPIIDAPIFKVLKIQNLPQYIFLIINVSQTVTKPFRLNSDYLRNRSQVNLLAF